MNTRKNKNQRHGVITIFDKRREPVMNTRVDVCASAFTDVQAMLLELQRKRESLNDDLKWHEKYKYKNDDEKKLYECQLKLRMSFIQFYDKHILDFNKQPTLLEPLMEREALLSLLKELHQFLQPYYGPAKLESTYPVSSLLYGCLFHHLKNPNRDRLYELTGKAIKAIAWRQSEETSMAHR